ncbi:unknown protein [Seminavis robusta]|uniref:Uncharacterized protein n=1 Tax=Seminavis robusta TaxID=568900 RepID=A0A9N8EVN5_9STRA|nr:unknown protein [Seminavis robusta]|eukprot:Sro1746_g294940.1 n/a (182) ;mRNA; r:735-1380
MASVPSQDEDDRDEKVVFKIGSESYESDHGVERYSDEDDSSGCCDDEEANAVAASGRMKSMGVMMGDDYDESSRGDSCCVRYWLCWICFSFLVITMIVGFMGAVEYQKEAAILYGIIDEDNGDVACTAYDDNALTAINNFYEGNNDTSKFCQEGFPDCQCKHPYRPTKPTDHGLSGQKFKR